MFLDRLPALLRVKQIAFAATLFVLGAIARWFLVAVNSVFANGNCFNSRSN
jgi:hypothetical protein